MIINHILYNMKFHNMVGLFIHMGCLRMITVGHNSLSGKKSQSQWDISMGLSMLSGFLVFHHQNLHFVSLMSDSLELRCIPYLKRVLLSVTSEYWGHSPGVELSIATWCGSEDYSFFLGGILSRTLATTQICVMAPSKGWGFWKNLKKRHLRGFAPNTCRC